MAEKKDTKDKNIKSPMRLAKIGGGIIVGIGVVSGIITILTYTTDLTWEQITSSINNIINFWSSFIVLLCFILLICLCVTLWKLKCAIPNKSTIFPMNDFDNISNLCAQLSESADKLSALQKKDFDELSKISTRLSESADKLSTLQTDDLGEISKICARLLDNNVKCRDNLKAIESMQAKMSKYGIIDVRVRDDFNNNFYKTIYSRTMNTLIISGHSLNNTINPRKVADLRQAFIKAIIQVLRNDGMVKILLQSVEPNDNVAQSKRNNFISFVEDLVNQIARTSIREKWKNIDAICEHLLIKQIDDLRYFIVQTDATALISHYKMAQHNENIYVFQVDPSGSFGSLYLNDFDYIFDRRSTFIEEANEKIKKLSQGGQANG